MKTKTANRVYGNGFFSTYKRLYAYISREFLLSFLVSFLFFFFIFFVNQLLLMLKSVSVQNLTIRIMLELVVLSVPQFLIYTFPFASLSASSMVIGNLSSNNEIMALRASGISITHVFVPIVFFSVLIGGSAFWTADVVNPWCANQYKNMYARIIQSMPSVALKPYSVTRVGNITISVGAVDNNHLSDVTVIDSSDAKQTRRISAQSGEINVLDRQHYVYQLVLFNPDILFTDTERIGDYSLSKAEEFSYSLDLSSLLPSFGDPSPAQVSIKELQIAIDDDAAARDEYRAKRAEDIKAQNISRAEEMRVINLSDSFYEVSNALSMMEEYEYRKADLMARSYNEYRLRYYQSEFHKRFALALACVVLVFVAFPISFVKLKHGRLIGFGLSIFVAVVYWAVMFFTQLRSVQTDLPIEILMWSPNIVFFLVSIVLLYRLYRT